MRALSVVALAACATARAPKPGSTPESTLGGSASIEVVAAGPMLTHPGGYPLDAWGEAGYGIGCADAACVTQAIDRLAEKGARVIKVALDGDGLDLALRSSRSLLLRWRLGAAAP